MVENEKCEKKDCDFGHDISIICKWNKNGDCRNGNGCKFIHIEREKRIYKNERYIGREPRKESMEENTQNNGYEHRRTEKVDKEKVKKKEDEIDRESIDYTIRKNGNDREDWERKQENRITRQKEGIRQIIQECREQMQEEVERFRKEIRLQSIGIREEENFWMRNPKRDRQKYASRMIERN